ncbi:MAG: DUF2490 domain-containing protein [Saprospiraceae bacterium]|nr:DUF2490 domain-containing protein [Saprospiraceae bacterium]
MSRSSLINTFVLCLAMMSGPLQSQEDIVGNWLMYFGLNRISDDWSIHSEVQYRNHTVEPVNIEQLLLRTGLNHHLSKNAMVTLGYAYVATHDYESEQKEPESTEHRIFQQFILTNKVSRLKFEHRYRVEQRWVNDEYSNRLRYRLMLFLPLNKPEMTSGTIFLGLYDEIFMNTEQVFFDRNRLYGAVGYQFNKSTQLQVGYLRQTVNAFGKNYLQFALVFNPDLRKD